MVDIIERGSREMSCEDGRWTEVAQHCGQQRAFQSLVAKLQKATISVVMSVCPSA